MIMCHPFQYVTVTKVIDPDGSIVYVWSNFGYHYYWGA